METRQRVIGHSHHAVPLRLERDLAHLWKGLLERAHAPGAVDRKAGSPQRADAAEQKPPGAVEAEGIHDEPGVPAALAAGEDGGLKLGAQGPGGEIEIGHANLLAPALRPRSDAIGIGRERDPVGGDRPAVGASVHVLPVGSADLIGLRV